MPRELTRDAAAEEMRLSLREISYLAKKPGCPTDAKSGRRVFLFPDFIHWYYAGKLQELRAAAKADPTAAAALLKAQADAELAQLRVARERGVMHHDDDAVAEVTRFCERLRGAIRSIESRYQAELVGIRTIPEAGQVLRRMAAGILTDLQRDAGGTGETADLETRSNTTAA